jgi:hypothetical protein
MILQLARATAHGDGFAAREAGINRGPDQNRRRAQVHAPLI